MSRRTCLLEESVSMVWNCVVSRSSNAVHGGFKPTYSPCTYGTQGFRLMNENKGFHLLRNCEFKALMFHLPQG